jgi:hypothetical protein
MHREWRRSAEEAVEMPSFRWSRPKRSSTSVMDANAEPTPPSPPRSKKCVLPTVHVRASELFLFSMSSSRILARSELLRQRAVPPSISCQWQGAGGWAASHASGRALVGGHQEPAGGGGSSTMRRAATHRERQIQGCVNGYREWRKPNIVSKTWMPSMCFTIGYRLGEIFFR